MKVAFSDGCTVRLAPNLHCPHCGRELQASDVEGVLDRDVVMICVSCHVDVMSVERKPWS
jgi:hypothetical protein